MSKPESSKHRVGTIEGVALILSLLACLILFVKIMPNLSENANYYNESLVDLTQRVERMEVKMLNLNDRANAFTYYREITALRDAVNALNNLEKKLPPERLKMVQQLRLDFESLLSELKE